MRTSFHVETRRHFFFGTLGARRHGRTPSDDEASRKEYNQQFGFYLPFNWRGFYDFGTSLITGGSISSDRRTSPCGWAAR